MRKLLAARPIGRRNVLWQVFPIVLGSILCGSIWITCGADGSDSYLPLGGGDRWETKDWTSRHVQSEEGSPFDWYGAFEVIGTYRADNRDWKVVEFSYAPTGYTPDEPQGRVLMQADAEKLEIYGVTPDELGAGVSIVTPSTGPLVFNWGEASSGYTQKFEFEVESGFESVEFEVDVTVEDIGISYTNSVGSFDDVMVLNLAIRQYDAYPGNIEVKLWLARGYGFVHAEDTRSNQIVGGDLINP